MKESITVLGSSSGGPQADRATSGYVLCVKDRLSVIECGGGVASSFLRCGFSPLDIDRVFVSHTHPDHCCELPLFIQMIYLAGRKEPLDIYVPKEFVQPFKAFLPAVYLIVEKLPFGVNIVGYEDGFVFAGDFRLEAIGNRHLQKYAAFVENLKLSNRLQSHSFRMTVNGKSLYYSGDIRDFGDARDHVDGNDLVILESTHIDLQQFFDFASTVSVGRYVITHLGAPDEVDEIGRLARKSGIDNVTLAYDGLTLDL